MITDVHKGKFFNACFVDETLEVSPAEDMYEDSAYSASEAMAMEEELREINKKAKEIKKKILA